MFLAIKSFLFCLIPPSQGTKKQEVEHDKSHTLRHLRAQSDFSDIVCTGPFGHRHGSRGTRFNTVSNGLKYGSITGITVKAGCWIDSISIRYNLHSTPLYGGDSGPGVPFELDADEHITRVYGSAGGYLDKLVFVTNRRRKFEVGGSGQHGRLFDTCPPPGYRLIGIRGVATEYIEQVEFLWGKPAPLPDCSVEPVPVFDIEKLPTDLAIEVAKHVDHVQLLDLQHTSRFWRRVAEHPYLWYLKVVADFGHDRIPQGIPVPSCFNDGSTYNFRTLYFRLKHSRHSAAKSFAVVHLNGHYLSLVDEPSSPFKQVVCVHFVWWLEMRASMILLPGLYAVRWRMMLDHNASAGGGIDFKVHTQPVTQSRQKQCCLDLTLTNAQLTELHTSSQNTWFWYDLGRITIDETCTAIVECTSFHNSVKQGFLWDYLEMLPCA